MYPCNPYSILTYPYSIISYFLKSKPTAELLNQLSEEFEWKLVDRATQLNELLALAVDNAIGRLHLVFMSTYETAVASARILLTNESYLKEQNEPT